MVEIPEFWTTYGIEHDTFSKPEQNVMVYVAEDVDSSVRLPLGALIASGFLLLTKCSIITIYIYISVARFLGCLQKSDEIL